jgi:DNA-dependent RNA polymerase auxiliary subunit epsilon
MKKSILNSLLLISITLGSLTVNAQNIAFSNHRAKGVNPYTERTSKIVPEASINPKYVRDFKNNYKNATDVKWVQHEGGASVYFTHDGLKMRSTYSKKGTRIYTLKDYYEAQMPADLRRLVKSNYYDHNIEVVTEVSTAMKTFHIVKMENQKEYLTLKIVDGEISIFERLNKM